MAGDVARSLQHLSDTLYRGSSDLGRQRLEEAKLGLVGAKLDREMGDYEKYTRPKLEAEKTALMQREQHLNSPFSAYTDVFNPEMVSGADSQTKAFWAERLTKGATYLDAKFDPASGSYVKKDGTPYTRREIEPHVKNMATYLVATTDIEDELEIKGMQGDPESQRKLGEYKLNPAKLLRDNLKRKVDAVANLSHLVHPGALKALTSDIERINKELNKLEQPIDPNKMVTKGGETGYLTQGGFSPVKGAEGAQPLKKPVPQMPRFQSMDSGNGFNVHQFNPETGQWVDTLNSAVKPAAPKAPQPTAAQKDVDKRVADLQHEYRLLVSRNSEAVQKAEKRVDEFPAEFAGINMNNRQAIIGRRMANIKKEIEAVQKSLAAPQPPAQPAQPGGRKVVERRKTPSGKILVRYDNDDIEEEKK